MAIVKTVKINVDTGSSVKELKKLEKGVDKVGDEAKQTQASMSTLTGGAGARFKGLITSIKGVALGFKSLKFAIAASGIGLVLLAITAIVAAFKNTEAGQNKFAKLMGVIGSVTNNLVDALAFLGEKLIWVFENPKEAMNDFIDLLKKNIINRFNGLLELIPALGKAMKQMFKLDFAGAAETAANAVAKVALGVDDMTGAIGEASDALKKLAQEVAEDAKKAAAIADQRAKADLIERDLIVSRAAATQKIAELRFKAEQRTKFEAGERVKFLREAGAIEDAITAKQIAATEIRLQAQIAENKLAGSGKEDLNKVAQLKAQLINLDTSRLNLQKRLATSIITFQNEENAANEASIKLAEKKLTDKEKQDEKDVEDEDKRLAKIQEVKDFYFLKGLEREISEIERKAEADILELEALGAHKELIEAIEQESADKIAAIVKTASDKAKDKSVTTEKQANKEIEDDATRLRDAKIAIVGQGLNIVGMLAKEGSDLSKGIAAAQATINTYQGVTSALSAVSVVPDPIGSALKFANAAAVGIAGIINVKKILATKPVMKGGAGGDIGGGAPPAPSFNLVEGTADNQINDSINLGNQEPIQAYVVSGDVTTAQNLDNNIITESGL